jgi:hypothetical protein
MFGFGRQVCLEESRWRGTTDRHKIKFIEAWKYSDDNEWHENNFRHGSLDDGQVNDWLQQRVCYVWFYQISRLVNCRPGARPYASLVWCLLCLDSIIALPF